MPRCPITYKKLQSTRYSSKGLRTFSNKITDLEEIDLDFSDSTSYSIDPHSRENFGRLQIKKNRFIKGDNNDRYIFMQDVNPENQYIFNRDLTLKLAALSGIKTVTHGLAYRQNNNFVFWYKRPEFFGRKTVYKIDRVDELISENEEDIFSCLREIINSTCTFPALEKLNLLRLILFNFLTGNDSTSLNDLSIIHKKDTVELTPPCRLVNNQIYQSEENHRTMTIFDKEIFLSTTDNALSFAGEFLGVNPKAFAQVLQELNLVYLKWLKVIEISFIKNPIKKKYVDLLRQRRKLFFRY